MATITICGASDDLVEVEILGKDGRSDFEADAFDRGRSIFLRLADGTGMRVERLQAITEEDAKAEGAEKMYPYTDPETGKTAFLLHENGTYRAGFSQIWDSTIRPKDRVAYCWESTPWVWVIEFERISKEEAINGA